MGREDGWANQVPCSPSRKEDTEAISGARPPSTAGHAGGMMLGLITSSFAIDESHRVCRRRSPRRGGRFVQASHHEVALGPHRLRT